MNYLDSILYYKVPEKQAAQFGRLVIQDAGGRMKPINTFSSELLRKVSHSNDFNGMNPDQVFLSMKQFPFAWIEVPLIYIKGGNDSIRKIIGADKTEKLIPFKNSLMIKEITNCPHIWMKPIKPLIQTNLRKTLLKQIRK